MGMFDSLFIKCPKCGKEMEWQSKSGPCCLDSYTPKNLPVDVARDLEYDIVGCQFCNVHWKFKLLEHPFAKFKLIRSKKKVDYWGNDNPKHPVAIKRQKELDKFFRSK